MSAIGGLIIYTVYFILVLFCFVSLILIITLKGRHKQLAAGLCLLFGMLFFTFKSCQENNYKRNQLKRVGKYYLTNYSNCDSCYIELKEDMTFIVIDNKLEVERGTWHHESGGDYMITYLNNENAQLGGGKYSFKNYKLKY